MSNFQLSLIIIGALVLIVVIAYNAWTTRRNTPKRASPREGDKGQEPAVRQEPAFDGAGLGQVDAAQASAAEPHFEGHAVDARDALDLPVPQPERRGGLDPLIDVIAPIVAEQQVSGDAALAALPPTRRAGSKPFAIEGLNLASNQWEQPQPGQRYVQQNAARCGFVAGAIPGRLVLAASGVGLPPMLTLGYDSQAAMSDDPEQSAVRDIMLSLDIAQVHRSEQPFARLREVAAQLAEAMDGVLCDQNGTPLPAMTMEPIAAVLEQLYDQLDSHELSAGSVLARRLFS